jgi:hypothetical protein
MVIALAVILGLALPAWSQRSRIKFDAVGKFVEVSGDGGFRAGGVLLNCQGKKMVLVPAQAVGEALTVQTMAGDVLPVSGMWFPGDGGVMLLLELGDGAAELPALDIVEFMDNFAIGDKVLVYGFIDSDRTVRRVSGKIDAIGLERIDVKATVKHAFRSGVLIAHETGKLAGFCYGYRADGGKKVELRCLRLDQMGELSRLDPEVYVGSTAVIRRLRESINATEKEVAAFAAKAEEMRRRLSRREGGGLASITRLDGEFKAFESRVTALIQRWQVQEGTVQAPYHFLRRHYRDELSRVVAIRSQLRGCAETLAAARQEHLEWLHSREVNRKL